MRQDDVGIVEGEWGRVEEITLTYVVVHIWDDRRMVLPLTYFIEKPFQNWTRTSSVLLGTVLVWVVGGLFLSEILGFALRNSGNLHRLYQEKSSAMFAAITHPAWRREYRFTAEVVKLML